MKLEIDNLLTLSEVPFGIGELIKERLTLVNPQYHKMMKMGNARAAYGLPPHFKYYQESKDKTKLRIGRGNLTWLKELCEKYRVHLYGNDMTAAPYAEIAPDKVIPFRDYQQGVVEEILTSKNGVVRLGTGYGKTCIMLAIAQKLQTKTLIIVPRKTLADQTVSEAQKFLGITPARLDKDWNERSSPIHVVTIQTLQHKSKEELSNISKNYGLICVDECHTAVPQKTRDCIQAFSCHYLYGFTGTAGRTDGQGAAIEFIFGPKLVDRDLPFIPPMVEVVRTGRNYFVFEYFELAQALASDEHRNELISSIVQRELEHGRKILIFTKRCEHRDTLYDIIRQTVPTASDAIFNIKAGGKGKKDREAESLLRDLRSGDRDFSVLLGTYSLLSTGFDCPSLDTLIFAGDLRSEILTTQSIGRLMRLFEGKKDPKIIDLCDAHGILNNQFKSRLKFYQSKDWEVTIA